MGWLRAFVSVSGRGLEAGLLLVVPLAFYRGFSEQFSLTKLLLAAVLIAAGVAIGAVGLLLRQLSSPRPFRLGPPLALWTFAVVLSCVNSPVPVFSLREMEYFLLGPAWMVLLLIWGGGERTVRRTARLAAWAGALVALIAVLQWLGRDPLLLGEYRVEWGTEAARMRLYSTFGNPNFVAGYLVATLFPAIALALLSSRWWSRTVWFVVAAIMVAALVGTGSRGAWAGVLVGTLVAWRIWRRASPGAPVVATQMRFAKSASLVVVPSLLATTVFLKPLEAVLERLSGRVYLWRVSWPMFLDHPWIGNGWGTFQLRFLDLQAAFLRVHPALVGHWSFIRELHNDPLQFLLETGVFGAAAFGLFLWTYARATRRLLATAPSRQARLWLGASCGGVVAILVDSCFNFQFSIVPTSLLLFTLLAFPALLQTEERAAEDQRSDAVCPSGNTLADSELRRQSRLHAAWLALACGLVLGAGALVLQEIHQAQGDRAYLQARNLEARGELEAAVESYRRGVARDPWNGRAHFGLARVLYQQDELPEALAEIRLAERTYRDSHLEVLKARVADRMGLPRFALQCYRRALALDPTLKTVQADIKRLSMAMAGDQPL